MTHTVELYWSFRSPYSYFVTRRLAELERDWDAQVEVKVVRPIAVRQPEFFAANDPLWVTYFMRDCHRCAEFLGLPFRWARPDPVAMDPVTRSYDVEQPYIHRLTRLGQLAAEQGRGLPFLEAVSHLIWSGEVVGWNESDHLARAAAAAGCDLAAMDAVLATEEARLDAAIARNEAGQRAAGHYGVPLMAHNGEPFFGQDRFDQLLWRMQQRGLIAR